MVPCRAVSLKGKGFVNETVKKQWELASCCRDFIQEQDTSRIRSGYEE